MALEITANEFEDLLANKKVVLADFFATWCGPCRMISPVLDKLSDENTNNDVSIIKLNAEENRDLVTKYSVRNLPTLIFFKNGKEVERLTGVQRLDALKSKLEFITNSGESDIEN